MGNITKETGVKIKDMEKEPCTMKMEARSRKNMTMVLPLDKDYFLSKQWLLFNLIIFSLWFPLLYDYKLVCFNMLNIIFYVFINPIYILIKKLLIKIMEIYLINLRAEAILRVILLYSHFVLNSSYLIFFWNLDLRYTREKYYFKI